MANNLKLILAKRKMMHFPNNFESNKRMKIEALLHPDNNITFRFLCHSSRVGGIIGRCGKAIKVLMQQTKAVIRIEDAPNDFHDSVISISAPRGDRASVSTAQEALIRVFERVLEVASENQKLKVFAQGGIVSCRMLVESNQVGAVIGRGGVVIEKIMSDCFVKIRVLACDISPCFASNDNIIEIDGEVEAVKKALIFVSGCLQDQYCKPRTGCITISEASQGRISEAVSSKYNMVLPPFVSRPTNKMRIPEAMKSQYNVELPGLLLVTDEGARLRSKGSQNEIVFRFLCPNEKVGGIIGKSGNIVKGIQNDTGSRVTIGPTIADCYERLITIRAIENDEASMSPAQEAAVLIFLRSIDCTNEQVPNLSSVFARFLISSHRTGCLVGKGGSVVSEMRKITGAAIQILNKVPKCAHKYEKVVQISGSIGNVKDAIYLVTRKLRKNLWDHTFDAIEARSGNMNECSLGLQKDSFKDPIPRGQFQEDFRDALNYPTTDALKFPHRDTFPEDHAPYASNFHAFGSLQNSNGQLLRLRLPPVLDSSKGKRPAVHGRGSTLFEYGSGSKDSFLKNTTLEIVIPGDASSAVCGDNGINLIRLRQISGAKVIVHEPCIGTRDRVMVISGTPDETQAAQSLLEAFIITAI